MPNKRLLQVKYIIPLLFGPHSGPTAILGIKKDYVLEGNLWQPIPDDGKAFANLLGDMSNATFRIGQTLRGYKLYNPEGGP